MRPWWSACNWCDVGEERTRPLPFAAQIQRESMELGLGKILL